MLDKWQILDKIESLILNGYVVIIIHHWEWDIFIDHLRETRSSIREGWVPRSACYGGAQVWGRPEQEPIGEWLVSQDAKRWQSLSELHC